VFRAGLGPDGRGPPQALGAIFPPVSSGRARRSAIRARYQASRSAWSFSPSSDQSSRERSKVAAACGSFPMSLKYNDLNDCFARCSKTLR